MKPVVLDLIQSRNESSHEIFKVNCRQMSGLGLYFNEDSFNRLFPFYLQLCRFPGFEF
jgi:hypothetical protein